MLQCSRNTIRYVRVASPRRKNQYDVLSKASLGRIRIKPVVFRPLNVSEIAENVGIVFVRERSSGCFIHSHSPPGMVRRAHLSFAAFAAIADRSSGDSFSARALPPFKPPKRPSITAARSRPSSVTKRTSFPLVAMSAISFASSFGSREPKMRFESAMISLSQREIRMLERICKHVLARCSLANWHNAKFVPARCDIRHWRDRSPTASKRGRRGTSPR